MSCVKEEKRNLFSVFTFYTCQNCENFIDDEEIIIGTNAIKIIPIIRRCILDNVSENQLIRSKRLKKMLREVEEYLSSNDDYIFLWVDDVTAFLNYNMDFLDAMLCQNVNFLIIH